MGTKTGGDSDKKKSMTTFVRWRESFYTRKKKGISSSADKQWWPR